jgi:hypothetical protein
MLVAERGFTWALRVDYRQLREKSMEFVLNDGGPVRTQRNRLAQYLKGGQIYEAGDHSTEQASVPIDLMDVAAEYTLTSLTWALMEIVTTIRSPYLCSCCAK